MTIIEFQNQEKLNSLYRLHKACSELSIYIEFFWESNLGAGGDYTIKTFPRLGSTLIFNIGSGFQLKKAGNWGMATGHLYYLRNDSIVSVHQPGNHFFGIQFKINLPLLCNGTSSDECSGIYPAEKFLSKDIVRKVCRESDFFERIRLVEEYFSKRITTNIESRAAVINAVLENSLLQYGESGRPKQMSDGIYLSEKTIGRYFRQLTGTLPKKAISLRRVRYALSAYLNDQVKFDAEDYGYYDRSHFYRAVKAFTR